jgi:hypothetical protein
MRPGAAVSTTFLANGNVGIGTTSPTDKLDVSGNIKLVNTSDYIKFANDFVTLKRDGTNSMLFNAYAGFKFFDTQASSERMRITSAGNVGIGTTSPTRKLDIAESINGLSIPLMVRNTYSGGGRTAAIGFAVTSADQCYGYVGVRREQPTASDNIMAFSVASQPSNSAATTDEKMFITSTGRVGIGVAAPSETLDVNGHIKLNGGVYVSGVNSFVWNNTANSNLRFGANGSEKMRITSAGSVGIGTTDPQEKLDISAGSIRLDDNQSITWASADANVGRVRITGNEVNDYLTFATDNSEKMRLTNTGLGIGTTSPKGQLEVSGSNPIIVLQDNAGAVDKKYRYFQNNDNTLFFARANDAFNSYSTDMVIDSSGNVGIGTTNPSQKLEVDGEVISDGYRVSAMQTAPAARNSTGTLGEIRITSNYIYVCYATNSWSRVALATSW